MERPNTVSGLIEKRRELTNGHAASEETGAHDQRYQPFWADWAFWTACGTLLLALGTGFLVWKTDGLISSSEKTAKYQLRAYIGARPEFLMRFSVWHVGGIKIELRNFGQTPAHAVRSSGMCEIYPFPLPADFPFPVPAPISTYSRYVMHPTETFILDLMAPRIFTPVEIQEAMAGSRRVGNGEQVGRVAGLAMAAKPSVDFCGYWQRHKAA